MFAPVEGESESDQCTRYGGREVQRSAVANGHRMAVRHVGLAQLGQPAAEAVQLTSPL
jgi:hypothetical protein